MAPAGVKSRTTISDRFLETVAPWDRYLIVTHDNPDPDAIAASWAIQTLLVAKFDRPVSMVAGGAVLRAENRHMVELLNPPLQLVSTIHADDRTAPILVDCGLGKNNHLLTREGIAPVAIIDHHETETNLSGVSFRDIRPELAASVTIAASYLREHDVEPGPKLATAVLYAIRTETVGFETHYSPLDHEVWLWASERAEPSLLAEIENAPFNRAWFGDLVLALQSTFIYDDAAFCILPRAFGSEIVGEVADLLVRCTGIHQVLCGAVVGNDLLLSVRTEGDDKNAAELIESTLQGFGGCGGHQHRAGGKITGAARGNRISDELYDVLRARWLTACGVDRQRGTRLVARREIVGNL